MYCEIQPGRVHDRLSPAIIRRIERHTGDLRSGQIVCCNPGRLPGSRCRCVSLCCCYLLWYNILYLFVFLSRYSLRTIEIAPRCCQTRAAGAGQWSQLNTCHWHAATRFSIRDITDNASVGGCETVTTRIRFVCRMDKGSSGMIHPVCCSAISANMGQSGRA